MSIVEPSPDWIVAVGRFIAALVLCALDKILAVGVGRFGNNGFVDTVFYGVKIPSLSVTRFILVGVGIGLVNGLRLLNFVSVALSVYQFLINAFISLGYHI